MRLPPLLVLPVLLGACATGGSSVTEGMGADWSRPRRVGILPFADSRGQGKLIAGLVAKGLSGLEYQAAEPAQMEAVFRAMKLEMTSALSLSSLAEIRRRTLSEALLFGAVDSKWREAAVIFLDTEMGEVLFEAKVHPKRGGVFTGPDQVAREVVDVFTALATKKAAEAEKIPDLPSPQ